MLCSIGTRVYIVNVKSKTALNIPNPHPTAMNVGQILVFLIGSYASFAIAIMTTVPFLA